jgi:hypothetical protein
MNMAELDLDYPLVSCTKPGHERPEPGYLVCVHVLSEHAPVAEVEAASAKRIGVIVCAACWKKRKIERAGCVCAHCAAVQGWISKELN